jgi:hypothetical protein
MHIYSNLNILLMKKINKKRIYNSFTDATGLSKIYFSFSNLLIINIGFKFIVSYLY